MGVFANTNEDALLVLCAARTPDPADPERLARLVSSSLNWAYVVRESTRHYVSFQLYSALRQLGGTTVPEDVLDRLKRISMHTAASNLRFRNELVRILGALNGRGVELMLLKGAALVQVLDAGLSSRPMTDLDVMVRERDFEALREVLAELEYRLPYELPRLAEAQLPVYAHTFDQIKFFGKNGTKIDTHFRLLNMGIPRADDEVIWDRAVPAVIGDANASVPSPEDMLLHLCFHANHHRFYRVSFFSDISLILERHAGKLDWQYLAKTVERRKMKASVYHALLLTRDLLRTPIPDQALDVLRPSYMRRKLYQCAWHNGLIKYGRDLELGSLEGPLYYVLEMDGIADKLRFIVKSLFPPAEWLSSRFSQPRSKRLRARYLGGLMAKGLRAKG